MADEPESTKITEDTPLTCPQCNGAGILLAATEESKRRFLESIDHWAKLQRMPNADLARQVNEIENYLRYRDLSPIVFEWLREVWWRLNAADEPIEETRRKIEVFQNNEEWLESD